MNGPLVLNNDIVHAQISMVDAVVAVREAILALGAGAFTMPHRLSFDDGRTLVMSAHHGPSRTAVVKTLSVELGRDPAILGTLVWTSPEGQIVVDATAVTTVRTGAIVGVATDALAGSEADSLAMLGAGAQAPDQVRAVHTVRPLRSVTFFDRDPERAEALLAHLRNELAGVDMRTATSAVEAVSNVDIVNCATSSKEPLFPAEALPDHVHINAIGSYQPTMRELPDELLSKADMVVVDQLSAATEEAGEITYGLRSGSITSDQLVELATVLRNGPPLSKVTVFKTVGLAAQDWAIARLLHEPPRDGALLHR